MRITEDNTFDISWTQHKRLNNLFSKFQGKNEIIKESEELGFSQNSTGVNLKTLEYVSSNTPFKSIKVGICEPLFLFLGITSRYNQKSKIKDRPNAFNIFEED